MKRGSIESFWARVDKTGDCWLWTGSGTPRGYGQFTPAGQPRQYVHRFVYELQVGPIPEGLTIDHLCGNRSCVKVDHLEVVSRGLNALRGNGPAAVNARKPRCRCGLEYNRVYNGHRRCSICDVNRRRAIRLGESA